MREGGFHFKVAPGRCDPPWVTLAESDLALPFYHSRSKRTAHGMCLLLWRLQTLQMSVDAFGHVLEVVATF